MADLLKTGIEWLQNQRTRFMSQAVTYRRGIDSIIVNATFGKTAYQVQDESGAMIAAEITDFIVLSADLKINEAVTTPQLGDKIETDRAIYEVQYISGDGCWRYSDPYGKAIRIHTKQVQ